MVTEKRDSKPRPEGENRAGDAILAAGKSCQAGLCGAERKQADADDRFRVPFVLLQQRGWGSKRTSLCLGYVCYELVFKGKFVKPCAGYPIRSGFNKPNKASTAV